MKFNLRELAKKYHGKLLPIKVCLFDVDGILTDGLVEYQNNEVTYNRSFNTTDAFGLKFTKAAGIKVGIITGGSSIVLSKWFKDYVAVDYFFTGNEDKREAYHQVLADGYRDEEIFYMGDEFIDFPLLIRAGFSASVPHAPLEIQENVDYVTTLEGGKGAVREVLELLRYAKGTVPPIKMFYGQKELSHYLRGSGE